MDAEALPQLERLLTAGAKPGELDRLIQQTKDDHLSGRDLAAVTRLMRSEGRGADIALLLAGAPRPARDPQVALVATGDELLRLRDWAGAATAYQAAYAIMNLSGLANAA